MQRYFSFIYWHFVGSPKGIDWHQVRKPADICRLGTPKSVPEGVAIVKSILEKRVLKATCTELISEGIETETFCCVTDIPLKDLLSHEPYYGKVAIGFRAEAIQEAFLPVLYYPEALLPKAVIGKGPDPTLFKMGVEIEYEGTGWSSAQGRRMQAQAIAVGVPIIGVDPRVKDSVFKDFVKITKFGNQPEDSFYREREWRCTKDFHFEPKDVAALVAPESELPSLSKWIKEVEFPQGSLSLVSWEFIEKS
jgi:Putative abortive phage resistance protein AbiGi, antitoxin